MDRERVVASLFGAPRALLGVVHLEALPGTPAHRHGLEAIVERAVEEARVYAAAGYHGIIIENIGDRPFLKRVVGPEVGAAMVAVGREVRRAVSVPLGVQVLAGATARPWPWPWPAVPASSAPRASSSVTWPTRA